MVDDGSTDDLEAALVPYAGRIVFIRKDNGGVASARNLAAARARNPWLAFQDSDDLWAPDHLDTVARDLTGAAPDVVCHLGDVTYKGETTGATGGATAGESYAQRLLADIKGRSFALDHAERIDRPLDLVLSGMTLQAAAVRRDVFHALGGFDETMRMLSDTAFFCQLALRGAFLVTGRNMADILRLEADDGAITAMHRTKRLYARQMSLRLLEAIPEARLTPPEARRVRAQVSGARFRMAQVLAETDAPGARRALVASAREHPSAATGWTKAALALTLGRRGFDAILDRHRILDRS